MSLHSKLPRAGARTVNPQRGGIFFGWWIVTAGLVVTAVNSAVYYYGMAVFFTPLIHEFGWSRAALSGAFSIARLEAGIAGPLTGLCIDRWGPRRMLALGLALMSTGFFLLSNIQTLEAFYVILVLFLSVGTGFSGLTSVGTAVTNWFKRRRGLAMGLLLCGAGIGGFAASSLGWLITMFGWRQTLVYTGIFVLVTGLPAVLVLRHRPEPYGLRPDGDPSDSGDSAGNPLPSHGVSEQGFRPGEMLRTPTFYVMAFVFGARHLTTSGTIIHLPTMMVDRGYSLEAAATISGLVALASLPGRLFCGWLSDRVDTRYVFAACMLLIAVGVGALAVGSSPLHLAVFIAAYGMAYGGSVPLIVSLVADYFGRGRFATNYGLMQFAMMWGTIMGPILAGYVFDVSGSYMFAFYVFIAFALAGMVATLRVRQPRQPELLAVTS